jgi:hypothetical protein
LSVHSVWEFAAIVLPPSHKGVKLSAASMSASRISS